jgi:hypothetical protein
MLGAPDIFVQGEFGFLNKEKTKSFKKVFFSGRYSESRIREAEKDPFFNSWKRGQRVKQDFSDKPYHRKHVDFKKSMELLFSRQAKINTLKFSDYVRNNIDIFNRKELRKFSNFFSPHFRIKNFNLTENAIEDMISTYGKGIIHYIIMEQKVSEKFLLKYIDHVALYYLRNNKKISKKLKEKILAMKDLMGS